MRIAGVAVSLVLLFLSSVAQADDDKRYAPLTLHLEGYEPNTIGFTQDSDDSGFMDFKISVKYALFPNVVAKHYSNIKTYFAFTGRFGQYFNRDSSPVVGKRFNPKLFLRYVTDWEEQELAAEQQPDLSTARRVREYIDLGYGHESNGQSINSAAEYQQARANSEKPEYADDHISRGWDYVELVWKKIPTHRGNDKLSTYLTLKYFLRNGLLQGKPEEYNEWENDSEGKPRKAVNGVSGMVKYQAQWACCGWLHDPKFALQYETGYQDIFEYHTWRFEAGVKVIELPVTFWHQRGYTSDLALYYKKVSSYGLQVEIGSF